jgi:transcriptional regulator with XRE-family HTH domain
MNFGKRLETIRKQRGLTIEEFAKLCGLSKSTIDRIEKNKQSPSLERLIQISESLGIKLTDLISNEIEFPGDIELLNTIRALTDGERKKVIEMLQAFLSERERRI